jgi:membrane protein YqaA with SNARE-associated domain
MRFPLSIKWILFGLFILITGLISLAVLKFAPNHKGLVWLYLYSIPSHLYISVLPHEPVLLLIGKSYNLFLVALAAGVGTCIAGFIDYETLTPVLKHRIIKKLYFDKQFYKKSVRFFYKAPFWVIVIAALTPIPYYPFKFLSIASGYPEERYLLALFVGRVPRYFYLATAGSLLDIPNWILLMLFVGMFLIGFIQTILRKRKERRLSTKAQSSSSRLFA